MVHFAHAKTLIGSAMAVLALAGTALPASAADRETRTIKIKYGDLDLTGKSDQTRLRMRVKAAVDAICKPAADSNPRNIKYHDDCLKEAKASGQRAVAIALNSARSRKNLAAAKKEVLVRN